MLSQQGRNAAYKAKHSKHVVACGTTVTLPVCSAVQRSKALLEKETALTRNRGPAKH